MIRRTLLAVMVFAAACSNGSDAELSLFNGIAAVAVRASTLAPDGTVWILDREATALFPVTRSAAIGASAPVEPPPGGWPQFGVHAWRLASDTVWFASPLTRGSYYTSSYDLAASSGTAWQRVDGVVRVVQWEGAPFLLTGATITVSDGTFTLPSDARSLPHELTRSGFAYLAADGSLAWWDPVTAGTRWREPLGIDGSGFAYRSGYAAWFEPARVVTASVSAAGLGARAWAPLHAAVVQARFDELRSRELWFSSADGRLHRVAVSDTEPGILCYRDSDNSGSNVLSAIFADVGAISNPRLEIERTDRPGCPGWTLDDEWVLEFGRAPTFWTNLEIGPETTLADLPYGDAITVGDVFVARDDLFTVTSVTPLAFAPPLVGSHRGELVAATRWVVFSARRGDTGVIAAGERFDSGGLALTIIPGSDPADAGDRFVVTTASGLSTIQTKTVFNEWDRIDTATALAVDQKLGLAFVFGTASGILTGTLD